MGVLRMYICVLWVTGSTVVESKISTPNWSSGETGASRVRKI